jgi:hypothetical protein
LLIFLLIVFFDLQCGCRMLYKFPKFFEGRYQAVELMQSSGTDLDISRILAVVRHFQFESIDLEVCRLSQSILLILILHLSGDVARCAAGGFHAGSPAYHKHAQSNAIDSVHWSHKDWTYYYDGQQNVKGSCFDSDSVRPSCSCATTENRNSEGGLHSNCFPLEHQHEN